MNPEVTRNTVGSELDRLESNVSSLNEAICSLASGLVTVLEVRDVPSVDGCPPKCASHHVLDRVGLLNASVLNMSAHVRDLQDRLEL